MDELWKLKDQVEHLVKMNRILSDRMDAQKRINDLLEQRVKLAEAKTPKDETAAIFDLKEKYIQVLEANEIMIRTLQQHTDLFLQVQKVLKAKGIEFSMIVVKSPNLSTQLNTHES